MSSAMGDIAETSRIIGRVMQEPPKIQISPALFTIPEAIRELGKYPEVMGDFDFYDYYTLFLRDKSNKETFMSIPEELKVRWLKARYTQNTNHSALEGLLRGDLEVDDGENSSACTQEGLARSAEIIYQIQDRLAAAEIDRGIILPAKSNNLLHLSPCCYELGVFSGKAGSLGGRNASCRICYNIEQQSSPSFSLLMRVRVFSVKAGSLGFIIFPHSPRRVAGQQSGTGGHAEEFRAEKKKCGDSPCETRERMSNRWLGGVLDQGWKISIPDWFEAIDAEMSYKRRACRKA
ncbi:hypothetical protein KSP40_PGU017571 [Platanthera guangdongensis]|uniref:Uncharacterized protein n=1 Tax=Platanthera guangdongensis TaxID=2320717 RepID=A0ABR2MM50_9ASPA